jgi:hypothetical protein
MGQRVQVYNGISNTNSSHDCELNLAQMVRFLVVKSAQQGSSLVLLGIGARIFLDLF